MDELYDILITLLLEDLCYGSAKLTAKNATDNDVEWITVKGNHIPIKKGQTKEEAVKEWVETQGHLEKSSRCDKIRKRTRKEVQLPKKEYAQVMHELNTNLTKEERKQKQITKAIGNHLYTVINKGFNNYKIIGKEKLNDID